MIELLLSDVDGTLVRPDESLAPSIVHAVHPKSSATPEPHDVERRGGFANAARDVLTEHADA